MADLKIMYKREYWEEKLVKKSQEATKLMGETITQLATVLNINNQIMQSWRTRSASLAEALNKIQEIIKNGDSGIEPSEELTAEFNEPEKPVEKAPSKQKKEKTKKAADAPKEEEGK